jgi:hypothetical protein
LLLFLDHLWIVLSSNIRSALGICLNVLLFVHQAAMLPGPTRTAVPLLGSHTAARRAKVVTVKRFRGHAVQVSAFLDVNEFCSGCPRKRQP